MPTCTVTGTLRNSSGVALPNTPVSFLRGGVFAQAGAVILERLPTTVSDAFGEIEIELLPGNYLGIALDYKGTRDGFAVAVPEAETADLAEIINDQVAITPTLLAQAIAARDEATAAAASSSGDAAAVSAALATASAIVGSGNGRFPNGTAALPSVAFAGDTDTGFFRSAANTIGAVTGGVTRWLLSSAGFEINAPITGTAVTQSATDTTAGRLMKVGDGGFLSDQSIQPPNNDLNDITVPGIYRADGATANPPVNGGNWIIQHFRRIDGSYAQTAISRRSTVFPGFFFTRSFDAGQWSPWVNHYHTGNILGTVSQSGGVPTGAIIERGSNANGEYVRYADGTQHCWHRINLGSVTLAGAGTLANPFRSSAQNWTYPASFSSTDSMEVMATSEFNGALTDVRRAYVIAKGPHNSVSQFTIQAWRWSSVSNPDEVVAVLFAVGRWF